MVHAYCEVACAPELVSEAAEAAFLDFVGRLSAADPGEQPPEALLLAATRSAAASRFAAPAPEATAPTEATEPAHTGSHRVRRRPVPPPQTRVCAAMPELLAARANGELRGDDRAIAHHVAGCAVCTATEARMQAAEAAFSRASTRPAGDPGGGLTVSDGRSHRRSPGGGRRVPGLYPAWCESPTPIRGPC